LDKVNAEFEGGVYEPKETTAAGMVGESSEMTDIDAIDGAVADPDKRNAADSRMDDKATKSNDEV
jgi:hypothetical protein